MSLRRLRIYFVGSLIVVIGTFALTVATGNAPVLGLDLRGGISVVLAPVGDFRTESLDVSVDIIRERVDALGVAEPEISRQGNNIVVDLPGVKDRNKARRLVGRTAELRFRPVLAELPPAGVEPTTTTTSAPTTTVPGAPEETTTTTTLPPDEAAVKAAVESCDPSQVSALLEAGIDVPTTSRADDKRGACVVLPTREGGADGPRLYLGPTKLTGRGVDDADSRFSQGSGYTVDMSLNDEGSDAFDELAAESFPKPPPQNRVAIVLDGVVQSSPAFQESRFGGNVAITGNFSASEADDLATIINYGALPVHLEELTVQNVSPTLGDDQLEAGIAAGVVGLVLVAIYMLVYYRLLGLVVIAGLLMTSMLVYTLVAYLGEAVNLTLTLAGITGLIVSLGVTVDSYVVYFERLKDEVRNGRTVRQSVDRGFKQSFRTILAADIVSLIGAAALYFVAVGGVRGFAFFLGISTALDLAVTYFFMHPAVALMARRPHLVRMKGIGIAAGLDTPAVTS